MKWKTISPDDGKNKKAIFSCAGVSKRGQLAFRVAKKLAEKGYGENCWLAGLSSGDCAVKEKILGYSGIVAIDGCSKCCALKTITREGLTCTGHIDFEILCPVPEKMDQPFVNKIAWKAAEALF